jgi:type 1 glutamine amidotransferase
VQRTVADNEAIPAILEIVTVLRRQACAGVAACGSSSSSGEPAGGASSAVAGASPSGGSRSSGCSVSGVAVAGASAVSGSDTGGLAGATAGSGSTTESGGARGGGSAAGSAAGGAGGSGGGSRVLIYCVTTGFRHGSIPDAANAIAADVRKLALTSELVGCGNDTNQPDATKLTTDALAQDAAVVLLANSGEPFGFPATTEIQNLVDYVQHGGALVAIEDADHCYDGAFNGHPASDAYVNLIGNDFVDHPGGIALATCTTMGSQASVSHLAPTFTTTDEIYQTTKFRADNQVVLSCKSSASDTVRPVSYVRQEGAGRVFFTALGHLNASWTAPMDAALANTRLVEDHVMPGMLWAMGR